MNARQLKTAYCTLVVLGGSLLLAMCPTFALAQVEPGVSSTVVKPTGPIEWSGCVTKECHPGVKDYIYQHGPVAVNSCKSCHELVSEEDHTYRLLRQGEALCRFCHPPEITGKFLHQPVQDGQCVQCHDPHGGENRQMLKGGAGAESCLECHRDVTEGMPEVHGPVAAGACTACHKAHSSDFPHLLVKSNTDLCLDCHVTTKDRLATARTVHDPVAVECSACHNSHASEHKMILKQESTTLCLGCHSQIKSIMETATSTHDAISSGEKCMNCHDAHATDYAALLLNDMVDMCLECHDEEVTASDGKILMNMKPVLASGKSLHGPIAQRTCVPCHQIHGGSNFRLLVKSYPPEFYAPFAEENYALCFSCHDKQLVFDERTDRLTNFRNGDHNMHFVHVNKDTKGRTCRACHETHASSKEKHIRDSVPFGTGGWELPINFEKVDTGGRCSPGCHRPYGYDRENPVNNDPRAGAIWPGEDNSG